MFALKSLDLIASVYPAIRPRWPELGWEGVCSFDARSFPLPGERERSLKAPFSLEAKVH